MRRLVVIMLSASAVLAQSRMHSRALQGTLNGCSDAGASDTYTCTGDLLAYATQQPFWFKPNTNNTGAATLNVNSLGAKTIVYLDGSTLLDNTLVAGRQYTLIYDGTNMVLPFNPIVEYREYVAAVCQGAAPSSGFGMPTANAPTVTCVNNDAGDVTDVTAVSNYGVLSFANNGTDITSNVIQGRFRFPDAVDDLDILWRTAQTTGDAFWQVQTMCVADGETSIQSTTNDFNTANTVADTSKGTANQWNTATISALTTTGCAKDETFFFRFFRNANHASDTVAGTVELISLRFKTRRIP